MKQRYNDLTHELCVRAVMECFERKWRRREVMNYVNHYAGISTKEFIRASIQGDMNVKLEAAENIAYYLEDVIDNLLDGEALDMDEVRVVPRVDGMSGKVRNICDLCILHQLLGHLAKLGLEPLFNARILPQQFASLPGRGQTRLVKQAQSVLRRKSLGIRYAQKTDVRNAYGSLMYDKVIAQIERDIPSARWLLVLLRALADYAPDGHLIIGGYLDAWLFNYSMSFALRHTLSLGHYRRDKFIRWVVNVSSYMDDFSLYGRSKSALAKAVKALTGFLLDKFELAIQLKESIIKFMDFGQEHERRRAKNRGCPCLDMGGYKIHRSYTTIRPKIFLRARRQYLRAWQEMQHGGTFRLERANKIIAYYGYFKQTRSQNLYSKYHVKSLLDMAREIKSYWSRRDQEFKKARMMQYVNG